MLPASRIAIERFSPYFNQPELGFSDLRAAKHYRLSYDLPDEELYDFAYIFDAPPLASARRSCARLDGALLDWEKSTSGEPARLPRPRRAIVLVKPSPRGHLEHA